MQLNRIAMKNSVNIISLCIILLTSLIEIHQNHALAETDQRRYSKPRRRLEPTANLADIINEEITRGASHPRFTLTAAFEPQPSGFMRSFRSAAPEIFELDVVLTDPSVTEATSFSIGGGESKQTNSTVKFLVADHQSADSTDFAILAVDEEAGTVKGIVQKNNQLVQWVQYPGGVAFVSEASFTPPQDWTCTVVEEQGGEETRRRLQEAEGHHQHDHGHHHKHAMIILIYPTLKTSQHNLG